jgi:hypothetical protein
MRGGGLKSVTDTVARSELMYDVILGLAVGAALTFAVAWWHTARRLRQFIRTVLVPLYRARRAFREGLVSADIFRTTVEAVLQRERDGV